MIYSCAIILTIAARAAALSIAGVGSATASKNLPFENKDAFFTSPPRYYGVFDGVSQCDDSRAYAQTLAKTSMNELASIDQSIAKITFEEAAQGALTKAAKEAFKYSGCSTACLLKLDLESASPTASIYNLGDCGVMVVRKDEESNALTVAECTEALFHDNGAPYQLGGRQWQTDDPSDGEAFTFDLQAGDTLLAFTDGLGNNVQQPEIAQIVTQMSSAGCEELAKALVDRARQIRKVDDDVSVVAVRVGAGSGMSGSFEAEVSGSDAFELPKFSLPNLPNPAEELAKALEGGFNKGAGGGGDGGGMPEMPKMPEGLPKLPKIDLPKLPKLPNPFGD